MAMGRSVTAPSFPGFASPTTAVSSGATGWPGLRGNSTSASVSRRDDVPARIPGLHFEVVATYVGVDTLVIDYRNQNGGLVNEVLMFDGALVVQGHGAYLDS
jgi:hypothetical protein